MLRGILTIIVSVFSIGLIAAQGRLPIAVLTHAEGQNIHLRWATIESDHWLRANTVGYHVTRITTVRNGIVLDDGAREASQLVLSSAVMPLSQQAFPTDELNRVAGETVHSTSWHNSPAVGAVAGAMQERKSRDNRMFYAHLLADRDFDIAKNLGLALTDTQGVVGEEYQYLVEINGTSDPNQSIFGSAPGGLGLVEDPLIPADKLSGEDGDTSLVIGWSIADVENQYIAYDIYRSPAGQNQFTKANEVPYLYTTYLEEDDPKYAYYTDKHPGRGDHDYHIIGLTPFGEQGPPSESIRVTSRPNRMFVNTRMDSITVTETEVTLHWPSVATSTPNAWAMQTVYRAATVDSRHEPLATLGPNVRTWTDPNPSATGYYSIELEDEYGHKYRTAPQLGQLEDRTPPATPTGFRGQDRGNGIVDLTWVANEEADLEGYRLFRAFSRNSHFLVVEDDPMIWNGYIDDLRENIVNDSIYYRLQAEDNRSNASHKTEILAIARADILPPGKPVLLAARPTPAGVAFTWRYSGSHDVTRHELRRRAAGTRDWVTVANISPADEATYRAENFDESGSVNYIDDSPLEQRMYEYKFIAFDEADNGAASESIEIRPFDSGRRGKIEQLRISFDCADTTVVTELTETMGLSMQQLIDAYESEDYLTPTRRNNILIAMELNGILTAADFGEWQALSNAAFYARIKILAAEYLPRVEYTDCSVALTWSYEVRPGLLHFQVLRSRRGSRIRPFKALPIGSFFPSSVPTSGTHSFSFSDGDAETGVRYVYQVTAVYRDGGYADGGGGVSVLVD